VWFSYLMLVVGLVVILVGCDVFTNSIEWLGKKLDLNEGVLGSIFAAVGTALPETLIPIVAVVFAGSEADSHAHDVGIGAIIGAPFMLATLAMLVTGIAVFIFTAQRRRTLVMKVNSKILSRDIRFFLLAFAVALAAGFISDQITKIVIAVGLVVYYAFYVYKHATDKSSHIESEDDIAEDLSPLHFARKNADPSLPIIVGQIFVGLALIIGAAYLFVQYVSDVANSLGVTALILSLIIVPIATELPEKFNSVLWVRRSKDTLALGNITGAMVFQSTLPVAFGLAFTDWTANAEYAPAFAQAALALVAASILFGAMVWQKRLTARAMIFAGLWYIVWLILVFPFDLAKKVENLGF
jgi:cation:H+ antiporter